MTRHRTARCVAASCLIALLGLSVAGAAATPRQDGESRFYDAESAFADGDAQGALDVLDAIIADTPRARYPTDPWRAAAAVRAGEIELGLGRIEDATARFVDVVEQEEPTLWTSRARYGLATALLWSRDWQAAAPLLQQVVDAFDDDGAAADPVSGTLAADRLTLLHRVWLRVAAGGQPWVQAGRLDIGAPLDRPIGVAAGAGGLLITDEGRDTMTFVDSGGNAAGFTLRDPQRPWWSDRGEAYVAARATVEAPLSAASLPFTWNDGGRAREVEDIRAGLRTPAGKWVLLDNDSRRVLQFAPDRTFERALDMRGGEPVDVARGPRGRLLVIEKDRREVMIFDDQGALQGGFAIDGWREPYALAIDAIGHVYVLDRGNKRIDVFDPDGGILWTLGPTLPGGVQLDDPRDIAVDGAGRVLVADRGLQVVVVIE